LNNRVAKQQRKQFLHSRPRDQAGREPERGEINAPPLPGPLLRSAEEREISKDENEVAVREDLQLHTIRGVHNLVFHLNPLLP
jgi:hypothetical protein